MEFDSNNLFEQEFAFRAERFKRINQTIQQDEQKRLAVEQPAAQADPPKEELEASSVTRSVFINNRNLAIQPSLPLLLALNTCSI